MLALNNVLSNSQILHMYFKKSLDARCIFLIDHCIVCQIIVSEKSLNAVHCFLNPHGYLIMTYFVCTRV